MAAAAYHRNGPNLAPTTYQYQHFRRDITPAGPPPGGAQQYGAGAGAGINVPKRHGRPNIDPGVWAIEGGLKDAWRSHMKGKGKGKEVAENKDEGEK